MATYLKVLIAIDTMGEPDQVLRKAALQFSGDNIAIEIVYAPADPTYFYASTIGGGNMGSSAIYIDPQAVLQDARQRVVELAESCGFRNADIVVEFGRPCDVIIARQEKFNADLIVVGSHGRHGIRLLLGSTANAVLHQASCDVLAIRILE